MAVKGVRSSCETDIRNERLSCSASSSFETIMRNRSTQQRDLVASASLGYLDVVPACGDLLGRSRESANGFRELA